MIKPAHNNQTNQKGHALRAPITNKRYETFATSAVGRERNKETRTGSFFEYGFFLNNKMFCFLIPFSARP